MHIQNVMKEKVRVRKLRGTMSEAPSKRRTDKERRASETRSVHTRSRDFNCYSEAAIKRLSHREADIKLTLASRSNLCCNYNLMYKPLEFNFCSNSLKKHMILSLVLGNHHHVGIVAFHESSGGSKAHGSSQRGQTAESSCGKNKYGGGRENTVVSTHKSIH